MQVLHVFSGVQTAAVLRGSRMMWMGCLIDLLVVDTWLRNAFWVCLQGLDLSLGSWRYPTAPSKPI